MLPYLELPPVKLLLHRTTPKVLPPLRRDSSPHASVEIKGCYGRLSRDGLPIFGGDQTLGMCTTYTCYADGTGNGTTEAAAYALSQSYCAVLHQQHDGVFISAPIATTYQSF